MKGRDDLRAARVAQLRREAGETPHIPGQHYRRCDLAGVCPVCGERMVRALITAGIGVHPMCEWAGVVASRWAGTLRRQLTALGARA